MAGNIYGHPAPGLGDLMPGWFAVPQNSITDAVTYTPGIGEIMAGSYVVPQNPIKDFTKGQVSILGQQKGCGPGMINGMVANPPDDSGSGGSGMGRCGCGGGCGGGSGKGGCGGGMGDISSDMSKISSDISSGDYMAVLTDTVFGFPVWGVGALLAVFLMAGGKESHVNRARRAARAY